MGKHVNTLVRAFILWLCATVVQAQEPVRVLWWDGSPTYDGATNAQDRAALALYVDGFGGGAQFAVTFQSTTRAGALAQQMTRGPYDILVLDVTTTSANFTNADLAAVQQHYQSGRNALMLDGTLWVRNARPGPLTVFPGPNGASAALLMNQMQALVNAGGGILRLNFGESSTFKLLNTSLDSFFVGDYRAMIHMQGLSDGQSTKYVAPVPLPGAILLLLGALGGLGLIARKRQAA